MKTTKPKKSRAKNYSKTIQIVESSIKALLKELIDPRIRASSRGAYFRIQSKQISNNVIFSETKE